MAQGLAFSTHSTYLSGQKKFYDFCSQLGKLHQSGSPCPTDEWTLCLFATFLANTVQHSTIKVYLSAVRSLHIEQGFADPLVDCLRLQRVLRGIKRTQGDTSSLCLLVTDDIMMVIFRALDLSLPDHCMFWAASNLAYFGFLRSAEFTVPNLASFSPSIHLGLADVAIDSMSSPSCLRLRIKASKTDPFRKGCFLHIGRDEFPLCAIRSLLAYLTLRGDAPAPLFLFRDRRPLSRALLTSWLRDILSSAGIQGNFSSHSFRIGAATVAARNGIPDHQIQALGRWTSSAYLSYIRTPAESLSQLSVAVSCPLTAQFGSIGISAASLAFAQFIFQNRRHWFRPLLLELMPPPGPCSDRDLYSWHGRWPPWMFLVSGCLDLVVRLSSMAVCYPSVSS